MDVFILQRSSHRVAGLRPHIEFIIFGAAKQEDVLRRQLTDKAFSGDFTERVTYTTDSPSLHLLVVSLVTGMQGEGPLTEFQRLD